MSQIKLIPNPSWLVYFVLKVQPFFINFGSHRVSMLRNFFTLLPMMRPNKLECLYLAVTFQSSLTFAGNTRSLPKKEESERWSNWVGSGLALKFQDLTGKGVQGKTL